MIINGHILQDLEDPPGSDRTSCNGEKIESYPKFIEEKYGFQLCEACRIRAMKL